MNLQAVSKKAAGVPAFFAGGERRSSGHNQSGLAALYRKELAHHLNSKRFFLIFGLLLAVSTANLAGAVSNLSSEVSQSSQFVFLKLFTTGSGSSYFFATFIAFLGPLAGITLGFDAVNSERRRL